MDSCGCDDYASPIDAGIARADRASCPNAGIDEQLMAAGLRPCAEGTTLFWRVVLYTRDEAGDSPRA